METVVAITCVLSIALLIALIVWFIEKANDNADPTAMGAIVLLLAITTTIFAGKAVDMTPEVKIVSVPYPICGEKP